MNLPFKSTSDEFSTDLYTEPDFQARDLDPGFCLVCNRRIGLRVLWSDS